MGQYSIENMLSNVSLTLLTKAELLNIKIQFQPKKLIMLANSVVSLYGFHPIYMNPVYRQCLRRISESY